MSIDLRDFPFMPLYTERLQRSRAWLMCKREPALAFYLLNLWMRSWHEVPCGSIEDDDDVLADAAMCDSRTWGRIKERLLRGWELRDGRLHHPVVMEIATQSWERKQQQRQRTAAAREARAQKRGSSVTDNVTASVTDSDADNVTSSKGQLRDSKVKGLPPLKAPPVPDPFAEWWKLYPHKIGKGDAGKKYRAALKSAAAEELQEGLQRYIASKPADREWCHPATWLHQQRWLDQPQHATTNQRSNGHDKQPRPLESLQIATALAVANTINRDRERAERDRRDDIPADVPLLDQLG